MARWVTCREWCEVTFTLALQIISTVLWCPGSSSLSFPLRYTGCLHLIVVVTLPWSCLGKHKNWMDVGWGHQPAPARAGPVQHHSGHAAGDSEATWARDQHVATIASFQHSAGHQLVLGGLFPTLYFIGAASVATPVPPPAHHPSPRPVPGGTCWLQNPRNGRCDTRYTASCFYKRPSRMKQGVSLVSFVNEVGQCTLSEWWPVVRSFFFIHIQVAWTWLSKTATVYIVLRRGCWDSFKYEQWAVMLVETSEQPGPAPGSRVRSLDNSVMLSCCNAVSRQHQQPVLQPLITAP